MLGQDDPFVLVENIAVLPCAYGIEYGVEAGPAHK